MNESKPVDKKRGWGLTTALIAGFIGYGWQILILLAELLGRETTTYGEFSTGRVIFLLVQYILAFVFLAAAWRWKKWGCFGYIALGIVGILTILLTEGFQWLLLGSGIIGVLFAYGVYREKRDFFE